LRPGMADPETMAGIMELAELFIGIDSGPLHMAGGLDVQAVGIWTHHHPIRFFDIADNVVHLVPTGHRRLAGGHLAADTFHELYRHEVYGCLKGALIDEVHKALAVSYTHLDVYKRQRPWSAIVSKPNPGAMRCRA